MCTRAMSAIGLVLAITTAGTAFASDADLAEMETGLRASLHAEGVADTDIDVTASLDARYDEQMRWSDGPAADAAFEAWTQGRTGYPFVDAGMRQLWATGFIHNRARMVAASFLVKHLRIARRNHMDSPLGKAANEHLRVLYAQVAELPEVVRNAIAAKAGI